MDRNTYIHVCYKVNIKLFLDMKVHWNKITYLIPMNFSFTTTNLTHFIHQLSFNTKKNRIKKHGD
jgi:hypothetical protein